MATITTYKAFTDAIAGLSVAGVKRRYTNPPASLASSELPASWAGLPRGIEPAMTFQTSGGWAQMFCDLVIAVEAVGQNTQSANYDNTIAIMDNLCTALRGASIGRSSITWDITANVQVNVGDTTFWAVIATIEGR